MTGGVAYEPVARSAALGDTGFVDEKAARSDRLDAAIAALAVGLVGSRCLRHLGRLRAHLPQWQGWLAVLSPGATSTAVARHIGFLSGMYTAGVLVGAPLWGMPADRVGLGRVLIIGLVGDVVSLLVMLVAEFETLWGIYALRVTTGFFVAAVVPVVSALVAERTPKDQRARRFAWLGAMSLLGFLFGPALNIAARWIVPWLGLGTTSAALTAQAVIVLSAIFGAVMMSGLARTLPERVVASVAGHEVKPPVKTDFGALLWLSGGVTFVLSAFELGIVLQGQFHVGTTRREVAMMFAECAFAMLAVNALLFFTALLDKVPARRVVVSLACVGNLNRSPFSGRHEAR